jgi:SAM-dependent methyltransferase
MSDLRSSGPSRAVNDYFLTEEFVEAHLAQTDAIPTDVFSLSFITPELRQAFGYPPTILDVACGGGHATRVFQQAFSQFEYVGLDFSPVMLAAARRRLPGLSFVRAKFVGRLPFRNDSFDLVYFRDFLIHVERPYDLVAEALRVSRRFVAFNMPTTRVDFDLALTKVRSAVRYNLVSWSRWIQWLPQAVPEGLRVKAAAFKNRAYDPPEYRAADRQGWCDALDRSGGAKDVDLLVEKLAQRTFEVFDQTTNPRHFGFLGRASTSQAIARTISGGFYPHGVPRPVRRAIRALIQTVSKG